MAVPRVNAFLVALESAALLASVLAGDNNPVYSPCSDAIVQRDDGFSFGLAFSTYNAFFIEQDGSSIQLSPCDGRLHLANSNAPLAVFRPKVDEISILTVNSSYILPESYGSDYMVAFAGSKYAARSPPVFVGNSSLIVTSFTLVLEFEQGRLINLFWKRDGCASCKENSRSVCLNGQDCAIELSRCKNHGNGGDVDCSLGIQLAFSGTDKHYKVFNSWYEVKNLRQYSLYSLYSNLESSLPGLR